MKQCLICGSTIEGKYSNNRKYCITPISEGGTETQDNIILLCPNHHKQADLGLIDRETLRSYTKPFILSAEEKDRAIAQCTDAITALIFEA